MSKTFYIILVISTLFGLISMAWWFYGSTSGFNRWIDLNSLAALVTFIIPIACITIFSLVYLLIVGLNPEKTASALIVIISATITIVLSIVVNVHPVLAPEPIRELLRHDTLRSTDDGLFRYRFESVNAFQRNARARLFIEDLNNNQSMHISLQIPSRDIGGFMSAFQTNFLVARMEASEEAGMYILRFPGGRLSQSVYIDGVSFGIAGLRGRDGVVNATFLIDIPNATATRINN